MKLFFYEREINANLCRVHEMNKSLYDGMICGIHVSVEWKVAFARTVERSVTIRRDDPILPLQIFETHVERLDLTASRIVVTCVNQRVSIL